MIFRVCNDGGHVNARTYQDLHTSITLCGLMDLIEMKDALNSWQHAEARNHEARNPTGR